MGNIIIHKHALAKRLEDAEAQSGCGTSYACAQFGHNSWVIVENHLPSLALSFLSHKMEKLDLINRNFSFQLGHNCDSFSETLN